MSHTYMYSPTAKRHSSFRSVSSLFHACIAALEKALSLIRRHVHSMTTLPHCKYCTSCRYVGDWCQRVQRYILSRVPEATYGLANTVCTGLVTTNQCICCTVGVTLSRGLRSTAVHAAACRTRRNGARVEAGRPASTALQ